MVERVTFLEPSRIDYTIELGRQCLAINRIVDAERHFNNAVKSDETNFEAALGALHCSILEDPKKAGDQVEAMEELHKSTGMSHVSRSQFYLSAVIDDLFLGTIVLVFTLEPKNESESRENQSIFGQNHR